MSLKEQLTEVREASAKNIPAEKLSVMLAEVEALKAKELEKLAPKVGEVFPAFSLSDQVGNQVTLSEKLSQGPVVLTLYRGGWCPYCNLELRAYQNVLDDIKSQGASLLAITPELPDASLSTAEKNALTFSVLSDPNSEFSKTLGLVFTLPDSIKPIYSGFGIEVEAHNGKGAFELPLAATYVIAPSGKIVFADVNADYTQRAEPSEVVESLQQI
ncbi:MAG: peroxiredoxin-like family protein [Paraglaciecola sp.]|uniref:peroxiredoxin-like family protein n=1 Tax=Paraglaciecola sp. TaxID=1920173 RepID=UPI003298B676